ncbi:hypothetical protein [Cytobacillus oceanisediminis]|uniref:hypothetical protein n=1 Tax=Cytobacillus oceanisediminis TaxID=665099 RepID=UPI00203CF653|nr:hypothetical protein [Cytobacillus oceanisediminis]MCM3400814.1 hypothetical protein [Cytobacillus oceanisediminis]MDK7665081.1 hypothetical protein [Cytobacillus oceanisediminis]
MKKQYNLMTFLSAKEGISMENQFQILVDAQRLAALIQPSDIKIDRAVHPEDLYKLLADEKITFSMSEEVIQ